ncbi:hypothetical protein [Aquamicrobium sp. LC103]|uniref:hypothetical protein n=1 Tax=Aquamicrobium sp. LC103 TaxID=1120658 RepID=UPI000AB136A9|nr:hypothetical protein [Aquamicrobium sp. LC103]TKT69832.1 hypothetical protein XW59_025455 [Aquamicrobium sp. LC103]
MLKRLFSESVMVRRPTARHELEALASEFEPSIQRAFLKAIADIVSDVQLGRIVESLERGDIDGALPALNVDPVAFVHSKRRSG